MVADYRWLTLHFIKLGCNILACTVAHLSLVASLHSYILVIGTRYHLAHG